MQTTRSRFLPLTLGLALGMAPLALRAQAHEAPAAEQHLTASAETPASEAHGPADHGQGAVHEAATEGQPHEGAEVPEGGEQAHEGGHHGPAVKLFGKVLSDPAQWGIQLINFLIFAGGIVFLAKGPMTAAFKARAKELEEKLAQAEKDKAEGEAQMRELEAKMGGLEAELKGIMDKAGEDAEQEKVRVLEAAKTEAAAILAQATAEIGHQKKLAEQELRALVAGLAVEAAAKRLESQVQGGAAAHAVDRAIANIGGIQ
ncbi:MAG TPA: ATP synthase F0 subunit B [Holophagaceae bacterium]|nr:ATP synthase F0 subunit B [Holophagaceae bacterium]